MTPDVLKKLEALGYKVGIAHGGVQVELDAHSEAQKLAHPGRVQKDAEAITAATLSDIQAAGKMPTSATDQATLAQQIAATALRQVKHERDTRVAFHERALEIAKGMPTTYAVSGHGIDAIYFSLDDATGKGVTETDQEIVKTLLDEKAHAERVKQAKAAK